MGVASGGAGGAAPRALTLAPPAAPPQENVWFLQVPFLDNVGLQTAQ